MEEGHEQGLIEKIVSKTEKLGWNKPKVSLEVDRSADVQSKLMLIGKILSLKPFSRLIVKDIITKSWNTVDEVELSVVDKNIFIFSFKHEADVRRAWDHRPWSIKGEHLILKKFMPDQSLNEVDFSTSDFWVQAHGLLLIWQNRPSLLKIGRLFGNVIDVDLAGNSWKRFVRVRVGLEVSAPLLTGFPLNQEKLPNLWIPFKNEKLGNFCYECGRIGHEVKNCCDQDSIRICNGYFW